MRVSHMSSILQAKAFADAAAYNEERAQDCYYRYVNTDIMPERRRRQLKAQWQAHKQFAQACREECRRLQSATQGRAA